MINPANYKFGTTSICRVPWKDRPENAKNAQDPTTGCLGCASGKDAGPRNIFGNKYGQNLAAVQIAREKRREVLEAKRRKKQEEEQEEAKKQRENEEEEDNGESETNDEDEEETDDEDTDDDDDDFGPSPAAGVWAGSKKLEAESEVIAQDGEEGEGEAQSYANMEPISGDRPSKKMRAA